jgi:hypothetical protein
MKHNTNKRRVKRKVSNKRRRTQKKGGFWPFTTFREQTDYISKEEHQKKCMNFDKTCPMLDTQLTNTKNVTNKINPTWKTCIYGYAENKYEINYHIFYITPQNVVIKSIDSIQIPEFTVNGKKHTIMIEDKYISCFLLICGEWYAIMRLFGTTLNTELLARTEKNRAFFKLPPEININYVKEPSPHKHTIINIPPSVYTLVNENDSIKTIKLNDNVVKNINRETDLLAYGVLSEFFTQKMIADGLKEEVVEDSVFSFMNWAW